MNYFSEMLISDVCSSFMLRVMDVCCVLFLFYLHVCACVCLQKRPHVQAWLSWSKQGMSIPRSSIRFRLKHENSNSHGFDIHRPSIKGTKVLLKVTKAIIIIKSKVHCESHCAVRFGRALPSFPITAITCVRSCCNWTLEG